MRRNKPFIYDLTRGCTPEQIAEIEAHEDPRKCFPEVDHHEHVRHHGVTITVESIREAVCEFEETGDCLQYKPADNIRIIWHRSKSYGVAAMSRNLFDYYGTPELWERVLPWPIEWLGESHQRGEVYYRMLPERTTIHLIDLEDFERYELPEPRKDD